MQKITLVPDVRKDTPGIAKISGAATKKSRGRQKPERILGDELMPTTLRHYFKACERVVMIFPAILIGIMEMIAGGFEIGLQKALETYQKKG